jgi:hypothetical protein
LNQAESASFIGGLRFFSRPSALIFKLTHYPDFTDTDRWTLWGA